MGVPFALASKTGGEKEVFFFKITIVLADCAPEEGIGVAACAWVHLYAKPHGAM